MAEELAFARKASGLVRGLSMTDAFAVGFMNQGITPSIWLIFTLGLGTFLGGNLVLAAIISVVMAGIGFPIVWGVLGGSMPRSGGEYIYNSRIIHPVFGIAQSFGDAVIWLMWLYVLAPLCASPGMSVLFSYLGWTDAAATIDDNNWLIFVIASAVQLHRLLVRGVRHQDLRHHPEVRHALRDRRRDRHRSGFHLHEQGDLHRQLEHGRRRQRLAEIRTTSSPRSATPPARSCRRRGTSRRPWAPWS